MKILHLNRFSYSGQTTHVFSLVQEQQKQGHLSHLVVDGYPSITAINTYQKTLEKLNVTVTKPGNKKALISMIKKYRYDLIHAHSSLTFAMAAKLSGEYNIPFVITCHGLGLNREEYKPYLNEAAVLFCISQRVAGSMHSYADKVHVIKNGVDLDEYKPTQTSGPIKIALVSRIDSWKQEGLFHLCKAVDLLEDVEFIVASNKPPLSNRAKYMGWVDNVSNLMSKTDIIVGTGRAIVEGLATGNVCFVLGRTYQGFLTDEKMEKEQHLDLSGLSGSSPCYKDIFFDLAKLTQDQAYLQRLQASGRKLAEKYYDNREICRDMLSIYQECLNS